MKEHMKKLQKFKRIGEVPSRRLIENRYDAIAKDEEVQS